jgi:hypothetical protein
MMGSVFEDVNSESNLLRMYLHANNTYMRTSVQKCTNKMRIHLFVSHHYTPSAINLLYSSQSQDIYSPSSGNSDTAMTVVYAVSTKEPLIRVCKQVVYGPI